MPTTNPLSHSDLTPFQPDLSETLSGAMISSVWARARRAVPQIVDAELDTDETELLRTVLRSAVLRWIDGGSGAIYSRTAGDFQETLRASGIGGSFTREELAELRSLAGVEQGGAWTYLPSGYDDGYPEFHPWLGSE